MSQSPLAPPPQTGQPIDSWLYLLWRRLTATGQMLWSSIVPGSSADVAAVVTDETGSPGSLVFSGNPTLGQLTVTGLVNVGDTTAPAGITVLGQMVSTDTGGGLNVVYRKCNDGSNTPNFAFAKSRGTAAVPTAVVANDFTGTINAYGFDGTNYIRNGRISFVVDGTPGTNDMPGLFGVYVTPDGAVEPIEQFVIRQNGVTTIGGTTSAPALKVVPVASQARWIEVTGATSSGNPTIGVSGGILAISASVAITGVVNVGDTTAPAGNSGFTQLGLLVSTDTATGSPMMLRKSVSAINGSNFRFLKSRGTAASPTTVASGDFLGSISCDGFDGTNYLQSGTIACGVDAAVSTGIVPSFITISTTNTSGTGVEALRITSAQRVVVAKTIATGGYTVATLPAGTVGDRAYVTDALAPAYGVAVAGGGAVTIPVFYNGAAWICA